MGGYWRYGDRFQLLPAPPEAPRASFLLAQHPFLVEFAYPASNHGLVNLVRQRFSTWELGLLLNLLLYSSVQLPGERAPHHWVIDPEPEFHARYLNEGYHVPGLVVEADDFTDAAGMTCIPALSDQTYYSRVGIGVGDVVDIPESLADLLDTYFALPKGERMRVLRSAYWLHHASSVWELSHTAYHVSVVTAVEAMLHAPRADPCSTCGRDRAPGPTARFAEFLDTFAPRTDETEPSRRVLYRTRSQASHGHELFPSDIPRSWATLEPQHWDRLNQAATAKRLAQLAIVNWLKAQRL